MTFSHFNGWKKVPLGFSKIAINNKHPAYLIPTKIMLCSHVGLECQPQMKTIKVVKNAGYFPVQPQARMSFPVNLLDRLLPPVAEINSISFKKQCFTVCRICVTLLRGSETETCFLRARIKTVDLKQTITKKSKMPKVTCRYVCKSISLNE